MKYHSIRSNYTYISWFSWTLIQSDFSMLYLPGMRSSFSALHFPVWEVVCEAVHSRPKMENTSGNNYSRRVNYFPLLQQAGGWAAR